MGLQRELNSISVDARNFVTQTSFQESVSPLRDQIGRLMSAVAPPRVEWHVARAIQRAKELVRPLGVKSETFVLRGVRELQMEFLPDGSGGSPMGQAKLRLSLSADAHIQYQLWLGKTANGPHEHKSVGDTTNTVEVPLKCWRDELLADGSLTI